MGGKKRCVNSANCSHMRREFPRWERRRSCWNQRLLTLRTNAWRNAWLEGTA